MNTVAEIANVGSISYCKCSACILYNFLLFAGGTLFSSSTGYVCPSLAIPMNDASEIPVSEDSAEEDCMLWCVQTPGCSAVRVHTTGSATCQLGVVVPGSKTPVEMANGWETYAGSSVKNGHVDENF